MRFHLVGKLGRLRTEQRADGVAYCLDFRPYGRVWSHRGIRITDEATANRVLEAIRAKVAEGRHLLDVLAEYLPPDSKPNLVPSWMERWLEVKRREVAAGDRSPTYLRELDRYAQPNGHLSWWRERSIHEIDYGTLEDWSLWLADRGLGPKTRWNVIGAFRSFVGWLKRRGELRDVPEFPVAQGRGACTAGVDHRGAGRRTSRDPRGRPGNLPRPRPPGAPPQRGPRARRVRLPGRLDHDRQGGEGVRSGGAGARNENREAETAASSRGDLRLDPAARATHRAAPWSPALLNPRTGRRWSYWALRDRWVHACREVGVHVKLYEGTKHTMATDAVRRGVAERALQTFLGHADVRSTRRYAQLSDHALVSVLRPRFVGGLSVAEKQLRKSANLRSNLASPAGFEPALPT